MQFVDRWACLISLQPGQHQSFLLVRRCNWAGRQQVGCKACLTRQQSARCHTQCEFCKVKAAVSGPRLLQSIPDHRCSEWSRCSGQPGGRAHWHKVRPTIPDIWLQLQHSFREEHDLSFAATCRSHTDNCMVLSRVLHVLGCRDSIAANSHMMHQKMQSC